MDVTRKPLSLSKKAAQTRTKSKLTRTPRQQRPSVYFYELIFFFSFFLSSINEVEKRDEGSLRRSKCERKQ